VAASVCRRRAEVSVLPTHPVVPEAAAAALGVWAVALAVATTSCSGAKLGRNWAVGQQCWG
jgi:hypothetical protein